MHKLPFIWKRDEEGRLEEAPIPERTCFVRGCRSPLYVQRMHTQRGTGDIAHTWECPRGHRYFLVGDILPGKYNRTA